MKKLYLVDSSAMFYRAFFALPPLTNSSGMQTNALYGFVSMTIKLLKDCKPDYIAYCFDRSEPSFRHEMYSEYKATRDDMPDTLRPQVPYMKKLTDALGLFSIDKERYEADDVIGSLTRWGREQNLDVTIVSGDKDFAQLVKPGVSLYDTMKDVRLDSDGVYGKWEVRPEQIIDYLAIVGDTSDNIPGVKGVGPKGAVKLLKEFGTLDKVYENIDMIKPPGVQKKMAESKESAAMARKLLTIVVDLDLPVSLDAMKLQHIDQPKLVALLQELGFKNFEKTLLHLDDAKKPGASKAGASSSPTPVVATEEKPKAAKKKISKSAPHTDWETDLAGLRAIDPYSDIFGLWSDRGAILSWNNKIIRCSASFEEVGAALAPKRLRWNGWDLKEVFKNYDIPTEITAWDSKLAAYVIRTDKVGTFEETYEKYCGETLPPLTTPEQLMDANRDLEKCLREEIKNLGLEKVLTDLDLPVNAVLAKMELAGIRVDTKELERQSGTLGGDLARLEKGIFDAAGGSFNIGSPKQMGDVLFNKLKLPPSKKTKTGFSTDSDVLQGLKAAHPIAALILDYRELSKLKSTYVDSLPALCNNQTGRVHTQLNATLTTTGRLSSSNPNLQNIPIRTARGREVRKAFIPAEGKTLISADYSQIELRVLAHMSSDNGMIAAFQEDLDIHTATASEIFSTELKAVTTEQRRAAKAVNFGIAYGQGAFGLADVLGIGRKEATDIIDRYFTRFPKIKQYMEDTVRSALEIGYVETLFGRRRYIVELKSQNQMMRRAGERAAINAPIQGTAADLVKFAMIRLSESLDIPILLQVHDELLFEAPINEVDGYLAEIKETMESIHPLKVPLKVNVGHGANWEDAH
jgi:DNA polymerase I